MKPLTTYGLDKMPGHVKASFLSVLFVLIFGCATFQPEPLSPEQTALTFESRTLDNVKLKEFLERNLHREIIPWPPRSFDFSMLTLVAFYYHPDLDTARAKWGVAQAGTITAGQHPNPSAGFVPRYATNSPSGISPWILNFTMDIPIETAGKRGYRISGARHRSEAARLNIGTVAWQVRSRLRVSLLHLYAADQSEIIFKRELAVQEDIAGLLEKRLAVGEIPRPDVTQALLSLDQTRLTLSEAQKQETEAHARVAMALGLPMSALPRDQISLTFLERLPPELPSPDLQRQVLLNRTDILSALAGYAARESVLQLEIAKQYPDIHLGPGYEYDQGENKWSIGLSISLPVFNQNQGPIAEAEARRKEAEVQFRAVQARRIGDLDWTLAGYRASLHKLELADSIVSDREKQQESVQAMFDAGEADRLALLSAELELVSSMLSRLDAFVLTQQSFGLLEDAVQHPLDQSGSFLTLPETNPRGEERDRKR